MTATATLAPRTNVSIRTFRRLALANVGVAVAALGIAAAMAIMQASLGRISTCRSDRRASTTCR